MTSKLKSTHPGIVKNKLRGRTGRGPGPAGKLLRALEAHGRVFAGPFRAEPRNLLLIPINQFAGTDEGDR
jgi:hypothetical protein